MVKKIHNTNTSKSVNVLKVPLRIYTTANTLSKISAFAGVWNLELTLDNVPEHGSIFSLPIANGILAPVIRNPFNAPNTETMIPALINIAPLFPNNATAASAAGVAEETTFSNGIARNTARLNTAYTIITNNTPREITFGKSFGFFNSSDILVTLIQPSYAHRVPRIATPKPPPPVIASPPVIWKELL